MLDIFDRVLILKNSEFFADVKTEDLAIVAKVLEEENFSQGDIIFNLGEYGEQMYIVQSGRIGISIAETGHTKSFVCEMAKGDCFGEMAHLSERDFVRTTDVIADSDATLIGINPDIW